MGIDWDRIAPFEAALVRAEVELADAELADDRDRIETAQLARTVARHKRDSALDEQTTDWLDRIMPSTVAPPVAG